MFYCLVSVHFRSVLKG